ncbi:uncharacterized protein LOC126835690 [Adelges cooleyi]|uniref:uncharacterized protein LOC126835690 n=1 Tax=Adelges cooleyi TaxID=133065 RepID=UPI00218029A4|nr:uncharacterized protein LOC126835690 [Adelges cooleyi]
MTNPNSHMWLSNPSPATPLLPLIPPYNAAFGIPFPPPNMPVPKSQISQMAYQNMMPLPPNLDNYFQNAFNQPGDSNSIIDTSTFPPFPDNINEEYVLKNICPVQEKPKDEISLWIKKWSIDKFNKEPAHNDVKSMYDIKVKDISNKIKKCKELYDKMKCFQQILDHNILTMTENEWQQKCFTWKSYKDHLDTILNTLKLDEHAISIIQFKLSKRKRKRNRLKKFKENIKTIKLQQQDKAEEVNKKIEVWQNALHDDILKKKRAIEMKTEANIVFKGVKGKIDDAKNHLSLFDMLEKLRKSRLQNCADQRKNIILEESLNKLKNVWHQKLSEYHKEELQLKDMLTKSEAEKNVKWEIEGQDKLKEWDQMFFGSNMGSHEVIFNNLQTFLNIRRGWDKYVTDDSKTQNNDGSCIPVGWIVPSAPCNSEWAKYVDGTNL